MVLSVMMYFAQRKRIEGVAEVEEKSVLWRSPFLHVVTSWIQFNFLWPAVFALASAAEWIAAVKIATGAKSDYEVAVKPSNKRAVEHVVDTRLPGSGTSTPVLRPWG